LLRDYAVLWRTGFTIFDLTISAGVFLLAYTVRFHPWIAAALPEPGEKPPFEAYLSVIPTIYVILFVTNSYARLYQPRRINRFTDEFLALWKSNLLAGLLLMTFLFLQRQFSYSRSIVVIFAVLNPCIVFVFRFFLRSVLRYLRSRGYNLRSVLIVGTGRTAQALLHRIRRNAWTGMRIQGLVSATPQAPGRVIHGVPVLGSIHEIEDLVTMHDVQQVFIALPLPGQIDIEQVLQALADSFVAVRIVPDHEFLVDQNVTTDFDGLSVVSLWENHLSGWNALSKRALDVGVGGAAFLILSPLFAIIAAAIRCIDGGPVLYVQARMGHDGRVFPMLKFRTMRNDSEDDTRFTQPDDDRCTRLGRFLRRTSMDELPQLLNVLWGHMSLVGPRPERPIFIERFRRSYPRYMLRHKVKAGMTGWAQVNGWRGATSLKKRLQYDLYYLHNWSLGFDLKILFLTLLRGRAQRNAY